MEYLTVPQTAAELGLTVWGVRARIRRGEMRAERLGQRVWAIPAQEVERWKELGRQKPGRKPRSREEATSQSKRQQRSASSTRTPGPASMAAVQQYNSGRVSGRWTTQAVNDGP